MSLLALGCGPSDPAISADGSTGEGSSTGMVTSMTSMTSMTTTPTMTTMEPDTADTTAGDSSSDDSPVTATDSGTTAATTDATTDSTGGTTDESTGGSTDSGSTGDPTTGGTDSGSSGGSTGDLVPDGGSCSADDECESGECYLAGILGGICGECNEDADCADGGCTLPNPFAGMPPVCNSGMLGDGCNSDICEMDLVCAEIINVPGVLTASTCSECETDADCGMDTCQPDYDVVNVTGVNECVMPMSLPNGHGCDLVTGDAACMSGFCAEGNLMMILTLGVCSECEVDGDCGPGESCVAPDIDLTTGLTAGMCV